MLALPPDTITAFLTAAPERFAEGTRLLDAGCRGGAVYLFGYVGEMVIKAVAFRHYGYAPSDEIAKPDREAITSLMKTHALGATRTARYFEVGAVGRVDEGAAHRHGVPGSTRHGVRAPRRRHRRAVRRVCGIMYFRTRSRTR